MGHPIVPLCIFVTVTWHQQDQYIGVVNFFKNYVKFYCILYVNYNYIINIWMCQGEAIFLLQ